MKPASDPSWHLRRGEQCKSLPQDGRDARGAHVGARPNPFKGPSRLAFAKTERAERAKRFFVEGDDCRMNGLSVRRAV